MAECSNVFVVDSGTPYLPVDAYRLRSAKKEELEQERVLFPCLGKKAEAGLD